MKYKHIDSIRGIAILMVILVHASTYIHGLDKTTFILTSYCQMGVQLFFIASAYTLCLSKSNRENENHSTIKYAIRRLFRIGPMYYTGILLYFLIAVLYVYNSNYTNKLPMYYNIQNILCNILFLHGFYQPANNNIVPGGWSIGTEMAFYVIFPLLYFYAKKIKEQIAQSFIIITIVIIILSQLIFYIIYIYTHHSVYNDNFMYFTIINQLPVFYSGIVYFFIEKNGILKTNWKFDLTLFVLLTLLSLFLWLLKINHLFTIIPFISGISFVFLIEIFKKKQFLNHPLLLRIGTVSFSMYIIHFIFAWEISSKISPILIKFLGVYLTLIIVYSISIVCSFKLALLSEKFIEKPFIEMGKRIIAKIN